MIGDQSDIVSRLQAVSPPWFGDNPLLVTAGAQGAAAGLAPIYQQIVYAQAQTRIKTATGSFLDLISQDFFGATLPRYPNEQDAAFRGRILANLFVKGPTRRDMIRVLTLLTGRAPLIIEPSRVQDCGAWDAPSCGWDVVTASGCGHWGQSLPFQCLIEAYRPLGTGIPYVAGWDASSAGWDTPSQGEWTDASMVESAVPDSVILSAMEATKPVATRIWTRIESSPQFP